MHQGKSEKAGIVTLYHGNYNFGGLLQAYALPNAIKKYIGLEAEQIDYIREDQNITETNRTETKRIRQWVIRYAALFLNIVERPNFMRRKASFQQFINEIPHSNQTYNCRTVSECTNQYRICICGGDQIWNDFNATPWFTGEDSKVFTLQFASAEMKKIAYAPSMAVLTMSDEFEDIMKEGLSKLDAISVREKRSVSVLKQLTEKPISVVVDPVLLLTETDWRNLAKTKNIKRKYILCYLLGDSMEQRKAVKKLAQKHHLVIVAFPHIVQDAVRKCDLFFGDIQNYDGPREFLGLIQNAEMVITDSFHACVFSMIFQTPFAVFEREKSNEKGNMNSRIYDFLEEYHLERQLVTEEQLAEMNDIPKVDFTYAQDHWKKRRQESLTYLESALKDDNNGAKQ